MRVVMGLPTLVALAFVWSCGSGGQSGTDHQDVAGHDDVAVPGTEDDATDDDTASDDDTDDDDVTDDDSADDDTASDDDTSGGPDSGTEESCAVLDQWVEMSTAGIEWPEGQRNSTINAVSGFTDGSLYVLDSAFRLFAFDPCANAWQTVDVDWAQEELAEQLTLAQVTGTRWVEPHFVVIGDGTDHTVAFLDPRDGSVRIGDDGRPEPPEWPLAAPAVERVTAEAATERYTLAWGGYVRNDVNQIDDGDPVAAPMGDGQLYDATTASWRPVSPVDAPSPRFLPALTTLGGRFVLFGGYSEAEGMVAVPESALGDGAIYDPDTDTWTPMNTVEAPSFVDFGDGQMAPNVAGPTIHFRSDSTRAFFLNSDGSGGIYTLADDSWSVVQPAPAPLDSRLELVSSGGLIHLGGTTSQVLDASTGDWTEVPHGEPMTKPVGAAWVVDVWTGTTLLRWGPQSATTGGCENVPAGVGCDPFVEWTAFKLGAMRRLVP